MSVKHEAAIKAANEVLQLKKAIKELTAQLEEQTEIVREYANETGELRLGDAELYERKNQPKFVAIRSKVDVNEAMQQLLNHVPAEYKETKVTFKIAEMLRWKNEDLRLKKALKKVGLTIEQDSSYQIKTY